MPVRRTSGAEGLPDPVLTPGVTDPRVTQDNIATTICVRGYTETVRPAEPYTEALKRRQMTIYRRAGRISMYEEDHLIPLELGGSPSDERNLWPEPRSDAPESTPGDTAADKDLVERAANSAVCSGRISLAAAQRAMASDWMQAGVLLGVRK